MAVPLYLLRPRKGTRSGSQCRLFWSLELWGFADLAISSFCSLLLLTPPPALSSLVRIDAPFTSRISRSIVRVEMQSLRVAASRAVGSYAKTQGIQSARMSTVLENTIKITFVDRDVSLRHSSFHPYVASSFEFRRLSLFISAAKLLLMSHSLLLFDSVASHFLPLPCESACISARFSHRVSHAKLLLNLIRSSSSIPSPLTIYLCLANLSARFSNRFSIASLTRTAAAECLIRPSSSIPSPLSSI
jgi:hypothetical protein